MDKNASAILEADEEPAQNEPYREVMAVYCPFPFVGGLIFCMLFQS